MAWLLDRIGRHAVVADQFGARSRGFAGDLHRRPHGVDAGRCLDHRFGHGKAEALAGLTQAGFIAASGGGLLLKVGERFLHPRPVQEEKIGAAVSAMAIVLTLGFVGFEGHVVRRSGSMAIGADRAHYMTDFVSNLAVGAALVRSGRFVSPMIDVVVAARAWRSTCCSAAGTSTGPRIDVLMDRELPEADRLRIVDIVPPSGGARRARPAHPVRGPHQVHPAPPRAGSDAVALGRAHVIRDRVEAEIPAAFPEAEIILHVDPYGVEERTRG